MRNLGQRHRQTPLQRPGRRLLRRRQGVWRRRRHAGYHGDGPCPGQGVRGEAGRVRGHDGAGEAGGDYWGVRRGLSDFLFKILYILAQHESVTFARVNPWDVFSRGLYGAHLKARPVRQVMALIRGRQLLYKGVSRCRSGWPLVANSHQRRIRAIRHTRASAREGDIGCGGRLARSHAPASGHRGQYRQDIPQLPNIGDRHPPSLTSFFATNYCLVHPERLGHSAISPSPWSLGREGLPSEDSCWADARCLAREQQPMPGRPDIKKALCVSKASNTPTELVGVA